MRILNWTIAGTVLGSTAGLVSAILLTGITPGGFNRAETVFVNGWFSDWSIGTDGGDRYVKAWVARHGLLAMRKTEAVYFIRTVDDDGEALTENCRYVVTGGTLPAGWWSITLYDRLGYLPMNDDGKLSFDASEVAGSTSWSFEVSAEKPVGDVGWVSSRGGEAFDLTLRLYLPDPALLDDPEGQAGFPAVRRLSCAEGGGS